MKFLFQNSISKYISDWFQYKKTQMQTVTPSQIQSQPTPTPQSLFSCSQSKPKRIKFRIVTNSLHKTNPAVQSRSRYKSIDSKANTSASMMIYRGGSKANKRRSGIDMTADSQTYHYNKQEYSSDSQNEGNAEGGCDMHQKEYMKMSKKLDQKRKIKIGTRNFNKSFYSKLANKIVEKPVSFFKFGLKQTEKASCKGVFTQLFNIQPQKLHGTLSTTQLWDNKISMKYLKQNQMFFNKDILIKQFQSIDKQHKQRKRAQQIQKQKQFVSKYRQMVRQNQKINKKNMNYQEVRDMDAREACVYIRKQIDKLMDLGYRNFREQASQGSGLLKTVKRGKTNSRKIIAGLEKHYDQFDEIANKFKNKMVVLL